MSKTITIIELFNRISKGEEVPKHIIVNRNDEYFLNEHDKSIEKLYKTANDTYWTKYADVELNYIVEIVEDEETIDINDIEELELYSDDGVEFYDKKDIHKQGNKINEIIRYLKQINKLEER